MCLCSVRQVSSLKVSECVLVQCQTGQFSEGIRVCVLVQCQTGQFSEGIRVCVSAVSDRSVL